MTPTVALIDSGVNPNHPHIRAGGGRLGCWRVLETGTSERGSSAWRAAPVPADQWPSHDRVGHGTAAAAAVLDLAPGVRMESIQVFDDGPKTAFERVLCALDCALELRPDVCNLSLGTTNANWCEALESRLTQFAERGIPLVAPAFWHGLPCYPGCLESCSGVRIDATLERAEPIRRSAGGRTDWFASPYPRNLPGLPPSANLVGVSMACANVSGFLARRLLDERRG